MTWRVEENGVFNGERIGIICLYIPIIGFKMKYQFNSNRNERTKILGESQSKEIEKRI